MNHAILKHFVKFQLQLNGRIQILIRPLQVENNDLFFS